MNFKLHSKMRYSVDFTTDEYRHAYSEYINHLSKINFDNSPDLLKYFGLSFFHDSTVLSFNINPSYCTAELSLRRDDDKEDVDDYCVVHGIKPYEWDDYEKDPFVYKCIFQDISNLSMNIKEIYGLTVVDTEINLNKNSKHSVTISFSEMEEIVICFANISVINPSSELVRKYTNNLLDELPYCKKCKKSLLTVENLRTGQLDE